MNKSKAAFQIDADSTTECNSALCKAIIREMDIENISGKAIGELSGGQLAATASPLALFT